MLFVDATSVFVVAVGRRRGFLEYSDQLLVSVGHLVTDVGSWDSCPEASRDEAAPG
jgi:hypothetical protein